MEYLSNLTPPRQPEVDLFNLSDSPKDLAINRAIQIAVEAFTTQDFDYADHCFAMAYEFVKADSHYFEP